MIFQRETGGGIGAVKNIVNSKPASNLVSGFFPAPQRDKIKSAVMASAGPAGLTHRRVRFEAQSILQSHRERKTGFVKSSYALNLAEPVKRAESKKLAGIITPKRPQIKTVRL